MTELYVSEVLGQKKLLKITATLRYIAISSLFISLYRASLSLLFFLINKHLFRLFFIQTCE